MSNNGNSEKQEHSGKPLVSILTVQFIQPGSSEFEVHHENVTPAQMLALASWLDWYAKKLFDKATQHQIAVPGMALPRNLKIN